MKKGNFVLKIAMLAIAVVFVAGISTLTAQAQNASSDEISKLKNKVLQADQYLDDKEVYTEESLEKLRKAVEEGMTLLLIRAKDDVELEQEQVVATYQKICEAFDGLTKLEAQTITTANIKSYKAKSLKSKKVSFKLNAKSSGDGELSYKVSSCPKKYKKLITVSSSGKVTLKKGAGKGTYKIKITAEATPNCKKGTTEVVIKVK